MVPVSLDWPLFIALSVLSNIYLAKWAKATHARQKLALVLINCIIFLSNVLTMVVPDEHYSRNA